MSDSVSSRELKKPSSLIQMSNVVTCGQRKSYNALLYYAQQQLRKDPDQTLFEMSFAELKQILNLQHRTYKEVIEKMKELQDIKVEIDILGKEKIVKEMRRMSLLAEIRVKYDEPDWKIFFFLPPTIHERLLHKPVYGVIDLQQMSKMMSKYSLALYELAKDYLNVEIPRMSVEDFRKIMGIEPHLYGRFGDLKQRVLDPAVDEVNAKTDINIKYALQAGGRGGRVQSIKFTVKAKSKAEIETDNTLDTLIALLPPVYQQQETVRKMLAACLKEKGEKGPEYVESNIKYALKNSKTNFKKYLKDSLTNDWAEDTRLKEVAAKETAKRKREEQAVKEQTEAELMQQRVDRLLAHYEGLGEEEKKCILDKAAEEEKANPYFSRLSFEQQIISILETMGVPK
ncbi:replication initiation protein [Geotalea sp. SG265]|uniref:replication initiation protein n=1 Tax=Geotalea sp. SG265 TaxID=2922867 RepID=UPI001FAFAFFA|nr:replication initiation protein [Geotalea sp. SG265]